MGNSQWSKLVFWVLSFAPIDRISYMSCLSSPSYQMFTSVAGASRAVPYNPLAAGSSGWELGWAGSLFIFFSKEQKLSVKKPDVSGVLQMMQRLVLLQQNDQQSGHIAVTGAWCTYHRQQVTRTQFWEQLKYSLACIPMASHSKQKLKDLVNCCFFFFFFISLHVLADHSQRPEHFCFLLTSFERENANGNWIF